MSTAFNSFIYLPFLRIWPGSDRPDSIPPGIQGGLDQRQVGGEDWWARVHWPSLVPTRWTGSLQRLVLGVLGRLRQSFQMFVSAGDGWYNGADSIAQCDYQQVSKKSQRLWSRAHLSYLSNSDLYLTTNSRKSLGGNRWVIFFKNLLATEDSDNCTGNFVYMFGHKCWYWSNLSILAKGYYNL